VEDVLDLYAEPYDPRRPVACFDERAYQVLRDVRGPLPMEAGRPRRVDYEYEPYGSCNLLLLFQPLTGWREVHVTERRTSEDLAQETKWLVDEAFPPEEARRLTRQLGFHYTLKHGSWLNMVEIAFSILARQCLDRRLPDIESARREVEAWVKARNAAQATVEWRFTTTNARLKFHRFYPK